MCLPLMHCSPFLLGTVGHCTGGGHVPIGGGGGGGQIGSGSISEENK